MIKVSTNGGSSFQWSNTEQVYPFEKDSDGSTLYCKKVSFSFTNATNQYHASGITNFNKLIRMWGELVLSGESIPVPLVSKGVNSSINIVAYYDGPAAGNPNTIYLGCDSPGTFSGQNVDMFLIYSKTV